MLDTIIEAHGLTLGYGAANVVANLDLEVRRGEVVALLGANGAGKSTTLLGLAGVLRARGGEVRIKGERSRVPLHRRARTGLGFVGEGRSVFMNMTTADNIRVAGVAPAKVFALFPELKPRGRVKAGMLSGGEQQMLALGRALCRTPSVLMLDELSLGLAPMVVDRLFASVRDAADAGVGVLLVEQQTSRALSIADRAYVMRRGSIVLSGAATELSARAADIEAAYLGGVEPLEPHSPEGR
jgi:branched-chain amino acid transport system ATP-binding protein